MLLSSGNPPTLSLLPDGGICLTYGYREPPYGLRYLMSGRQPRQLAVCFCEPLALMLALMLTDRAQMASAIILVSGGAKK